MKRTAPIAGQQRFTRTVTPCTESRLKEISIHWKLTHRIVLIVFLSLSKQTTCISTVWPLDSSCTICVYPPLLESDSNHMSDHPSVYFILSSMSSGVVSKSLTVWLLCNLWCLQKLAKKTRNHQGEGGSFSIQKWNESHFCCTRGIPVQEHTQVNTCVFTSGSFRTPSPGKIGSVLYERWLTVTFTIMMFQSMLIPFSGFEKVVIYGSNRWGSTSHQIARI